MFTSRRWVRLLLCGGCLAANLCLTLGTAACQAPLSSTISRSLFKVVFIESVMLSNHLILYCRLLLPSIFPNVKISSLQTAKVIGVSASVLPMNIQGWLPLGWTGLISLQSKGLSRAFSSTTIWKHWFFGTQPSLWSNSHIHTLLLLFLLLALSKGLLWKEG